MSSSKIDFHKFFAALTEMTPAERRGIVKEFIGGDEDKISRFIRDIFRGEIILDHDVPKIEVQHDGNSDKDKMEGNDIIVSAEAFEYVKVVKNSTELDYPIRDLIEKVGNLSPLPPRSKHNSLSPIEIDELWEKCPELEKIPGITSLEEFLNLSTHFFDTFYNDRTIHKLSGPEYEIFQKHITLNFETLSTLLRSIDNKIFVHAVMYLIARMSPRLYFHAESGELLQAQRIRLEYCVGLIQRMRAIKMFKEGSQQNLSFWNEVEFLLQNDSMKLPVREAQYLQLEPELTWISYYAKLTGYNRTPSLLAKICKILNVQQFGKTKRTILQSRLRPYLSERTTAMASVELLKPRLIYPPLI